MNSKNENEIGFVNSMIIFAKMEFQCGPVVAPLLLYRLLDVVDANIRDDLLRLKQIPLLLYHSIIREPRFSFNGCFYYLCQQLLRPGSSPLHSFILGPSIGLSLAHVSLPSPSMHKWVPTL